MIIAVHGFGFDPGSKDNDPSALFAAWSKMLGQEVVPFPWYSSPISLGGEVRAMEHGYLDQYAYAFKNLAPSASITLAHRVIALGGKIDCIAHSLGTKVALGSLHLAPTSFNRVLLLDGAEIQAEAPTSLPTGVTVLNCCVKEDKVLSALGSKFNDVKISPCIGQAGRGCVITGWKDLFLDDPATQRDLHDKYDWEVGASPRHQLFSGDITADLRNIGDHWESYGNPNNHDLYRAFFGGRFDG